MTTDFLTQNREDLNVSSSDSVLLTPISVLYWTLGVMLVLILVLGWGWNTPMDAPYIFDDESSIHENSTIRSLFDEPSMWSPPARGGITVRGRPLLNVSLALDYALTGLEASGFRRTNLFIHGINALLLFLIISILLTSRAVPLVLRRNALSISALSAVAWAAHPIGTSAVTYIIQRAESLSTMMMLSSLTFACFALRLPESRHGRFFVVASSVAAVLASLTKETAIVIPGIAWLIHLAFFSGSYQACWSGHKKLYAALIASAVLPTGILIFLAEGRGGTVGGGDIKPWEYLFGQGQILCTYMIGFLSAKITIFDFGELAPVTPYSFACFGAVAGYVVMTGYLLWQRPVLGAPMMIVLLILGPTSSIVPVQTQVGIFHRFYLPAAVFMSLLISCCTVVWPFHWRGNRSLSVLIACGLVGYLTYQSAMRNQDFKVPGIVWEKSFESWPNSYNAVPHITSLAAERGDWDRVDRIHNRYLAFGGNELGVQRNLCKLFHFIGRRDDALQLGKELVESHPDEPSCWNDYSLYLRESGDIDGALQAINQAIELQDDNGLYYRNRAEIFRRLSVDQAIQRDFAKAIELDPLDSDSFFGLGSYWIDRGRFDLAAKAMQHVVELKANSHEAMFWLAQIAAAQGDNRNAKRWITEALRYQDTSEYRSFQNSLQ